MNTTGGFFGSLLLIDGELIGGAARPVLCVCKQIPSLYSQVLAISLLPSEWHGPATQLCSAPGVAQESGLLHFYLRCLHRGRNLSQVRRGVRMGSEDIQTPKRK